MQICNPIMRVCALWRTGPVPRLALSIRHQLHPPGAQHDRSFSPRQQPGHASVQIVGACTVGPLCHRLGPPHCRYSRLVAPTHRSHAGHGGHCPRLGGAGCGCRRWRRVGPTGRVLATDLSPVILALALHNAQQAGLRNVQTLVADGEDLAVEPTSFDAVVCRLGLMFFPDPLQGLRGMHRALRPGGGICTMVFSRPERNPCIGILMSTAMQHAGLRASLGKPGLADALFGAAGFQEIATTTLDAPFHVPTARHYLDFVRASASPIQQILSRLSPQAANDAWADMEESLSTFATPGGWVGPNELQLTAARR